MPGYSRSDVRLVSRLVQEIYSFAPFESFAEQLLSRLQEVVRADLIGVLENPPDGGPPFYQFDPPGVATEKTHKIWEYVGHEHPVLNHYLRTQETEFFKISDFMPRGRYRDTALYNELYKGMDVEDGMVSFFQPRQGCLAAVALHRDRRSFRERDREVLNLLQPHIVQAWRNAKEISALRAQVEEMRHIINGFDCGVIALTSDGRARTMSPWARGVLGEFCGTQALDNEQLPDCIQQWVAACEQQFRFEQVPAPLVPLRIERVDSVLILRLVLRPLQNLLLLRVQHKTVAERAGLTRRQKEVLTWVAQGKTNEEIGTILKMSHRTVQKHLENIFTKLGVGTRTAAAHIGLELAKRDLPA